MEPTSDYATTAELVNLFVCDPTDEIEVEELFARLSSDASVATHDGEWRREACGRWQFYQYEEIE